MDTKTIKYHNVAVKRAWDALSDRGVKIGNIILTGLGKRKYEQIRNRFVSTYKGADMMSHALLEDAFNIVPGFLEEVQSQEILHNNPSNVESVKDDFARTVTEMLENGPMMQKINAMMEEILELKARLNAKD